MDDSEVTFFQSLVDLRELLTSDYTGDHAEMKSLVDDNLTKMLKKNLEKDKK